MSTETVGGEENRFPRKYESLRTSLAGGSRWQYPFQNRVAKIRSLSAQGLALTLLWEDKNLEAQEDPVQTWSDEEMLARGKNKNRRRENRGARMHN